jgi:hypothetical protein
MTSRHKPTYAFVKEEDRRPENALFKNSLRSWQAQWKARKAGQASAAQEMDKFLGRASS